MLNKIQDTIHLVMNSKGGVGKSVVSVLLAQYLLEKQKGKVMLVDTDPANKTLASFKALKVDAVDVISEDTDLVDQSKFDSFLEKFLENDKACIVDTGSGEFLPLNDYLIKNKIHEVIAEMGKQLIVHVPVNYGQAEVETMKVLVKIIGNYPEVPIVVWENEYFGKSKVRFKDTVLFEQNENILGAVLIAKKNEDTDVKDFSTMLKKGLTFDEVEKGKDFQLLQKLRIKRMKTEIFDQLEAVLGGGAENSAIEDKAE